MDSKVQVCSPDEAAAIIRRMTDGGERLPSMRAKFMGHVDAVARNVETGEVEWEFHKTNLVTDAARRLWTADGVFGSQTGSGLAQWNIFTSPSTDPLSVLRYGFGDDASTNGSQAASVAPTYDATTLTKTWSHTFATPPPSNRQIGLIGMGGRHADYGVIIYCGTLLSPAKIQTPSQTLELVYKVTGIFE